MTDLIPFRIFKPNRKENIGAYDGYGDNLCSKFLGLLKSMVNLEVVVRFDFIYLFIFFVLALSSPL